MPRLTGNLWKRTACGFATIAPNYLGGEMKILVFIGAIIGALCLLASFFVQGAPQEAALAGMACAFAIIPYVLFKVQAMASAEDQRREIIELLKQK